VAFFFISYLFLCRHKFSKVLSSLLVYIKYTRALTFENVDRFSKVLSILPVYSKYTRALTFENVDRFSKVLSILL
jgi:hypothetical protein